jgi:hypothetical protein
MAEIPRSEFSSHAAVALAMEVVRGPLWLGCPTATLPAFQQVRPDIAGTAVPVQQRQQPMVSAAVFMLAAALVPPEIS